MNVIETHHLTRKFWRNEAVHDLSLDVPAGSITALLGPNGAGKSTTIRMLMNLVRPTSGQARVLGVDSLRLGPREFAQIGYVSESQNLPLWMTVQQFLDYCRPFYPTWDRELESALLAQFALPLDRRLSQLSRGMLMKAALLGSLAYRPKLLVLDEPFSGLDPLMREEFVQGILEVSLAGEWSVLVSSHDIEEVERLADHVILLKAGRLSFSESAEALQARYRRVEVSGIASDASGPLGSMEWERSGQLARYIDAGYRENETEAAWLGRFPGAVVIAQPMSLREIFLAHARQARIETKGGRT